MKKVLFLLFSLCAVGSAWAMDGDLPFSAGSASHDVPSRYETPPPPYGSLFLDDRHVASAAADTMPSHAASAAAQSVAEMRWREAATLWDRLSVYSLAFRQDNTLLASGSGDKTVKLWNLLRVESVPVKTPGGHEDFVCSVAFSLDGTMLASGSGDKTIKSWSPWFGDCLNTLHGHKDTVYSVAFNRGGMLASGSGDKKIKFWNLTTGKCLHTLCGCKDLVHSVEFSPDGTLLASGSFDNMVRLWDSEVGEARSFTECKGSVYSVAFKPDDATLASGDAEGEVVLSDLRGAIIARLLHAHKYTVSAVAFGPDGNSLVSGAYDGAIKSWDLRTGTCLQKINFFSQVNSLALSRDGTALALGVYETIQLLRLGS